MARLLRSYGIAGIRAPAAVGPGIVFRAEISVTKVAGHASNRARRNRREPWSGLRAPAVVETPIVVERLAPLKVKLAARAFDVRRSPNYRLAPPAVVGASIVYPRPPAYLAYSRRGAPRSIGLLHVPDIGSTVAFYGPRVYTVRNKVKPTTIHLRPPTVVTAEVSDIFGGPRVKLVPLGRRRPPTTTHLFPPAVVTSTQVFYGPKVYLTELTWRRRRRRTQVPGLLPVPRPEVFSGPKVYLTELTWRRRRRRPQIQGLQPVPPAFQPVGKVATHLAYSRRGKARPSLPVVVYDAQIYEPIAGYLTPPRSRNPGIHSSLKPPTVTVVSAVYYGPQVHLAPSRRGVPKSFLNPPTDLVDQADLGYVRTHLAYSLRGKPKSRLLPVPAAFKAIGFEIRAHLAYSRRGVPKSTLHAPTVIDLSPQVYYLTVELAPSFRGKPRHFLRPPTDISDAQDVGVLRTHLAYSRRGVPKSTLHAPAVVAPVLARPILTKFVRIRPVKTEATKLGAPVVVYLAVEIYGPELHLTRIKHPPVQHFLRPPADLVDEADKGRVLVHLAPSATQARRAHNRLAPPTVVFPFFARAIDTTLVRIRPPKRFWVLGKPTDTVGDEDQGRVKVELAPSTRLGRAPHSRLEPPTVIDDGPQVYYLWTWLTYSSRGRPKSFLPQASLYAPQPKAETQLAITLAYQSRGKPKSRLFPPTVVDAATPYFRELPTTLVRIRPVPTYSELRRPIDLIDREDIGYVRVHLAYSLRGEPKSFLRPPVVVQAFVQRPIEVVLVRIRPPAVHSILRRPTDLVDEADKGYVRTHLAYSRRGAPKSHLAPPTVVFPFFARQTDITLARITPPPVHSILRRPTDLVDEADKGQIEVTLAPSATQAREAHSRLQPPTVVQAFVARPIQVFLARIKHPPVGHVLRAPVDIVDQADVGYLRVHLAYALRGKPKSRLEPPAVVAYDTRIYGGPRVKLTYSRRGVPKSRLFPPTVVTAPTPKAEYDLRVWLAYSRRGTPKSELRPPVVIDNGPQAYYLAIWLTYSSRGVPKSILRPESKFAPQPQTRYTLMSHLAYSLRGKPKSFLRPPTVVTAATPFIATETYWLAYSRRGQPKSFLKPPTVVAVAAQIYPTISVHLIRKRPPVVHSALRDPAVINNPSQVVYLAVLLAPSKRGAPKSALHAPSVIDNSPQTYYLATTLARIKHPPVKYFLRPPTVVDVVAQYFYGPAVTLAYSRRGAPKSLLPTVIYEARAYAPITVTLAPSTRGRPKSRLLAVPAAFRPVGELKVNLTYSRRGRPVYFLNPPTDTVGLEDQGRVVTTLAYQSRGKAKSKLPTVIYGARVYAPISVTLAPSRRPKPKSFAVRAYVIKSRDVFRPIDITLAPPRRGVAKPKLRQIVYAARVYEPISTSLAYSRRGKPKSRLLGVIYPARVHAPISTTLAPSPAQARRTHWHLGPPLVVSYFVAAPIRVTLARIRPVKTIWRLLPPAVVTTPSAVEIYGPKVTLVRIRPVRTLTMLKPSIPPVCYGVVCGFDYAPKVIGGDSGPTVVGGDSGATVSGGDSAAVVTGATGSDATVSGGDERREGC